MDEKMIERLAKIEAVQNYIKAIDELGNIEAKNQELEDQIKRIQDEIAEYGGEESFFSKELVDEKRKKEEELNNGTENAKANKEVINNNTTVIQAELISSINKDIEQLEEQAAKILKEKEGLAKKEKEAIEVIEYRINSAKQNRYGVNEDEVKRLENEKAEIPNEYKQEAARIDEQLKGYSDKAKELQLEKKQASNINIIQDLRKYLPKIQAIIDKIKATERENRNININRKLKEESVQSLDDAMARSMTGEDEENIEQENNEPLETETATTTEQTNSNPEGKEPAQPSKEERAEQKAKENQDYSEFYRSDWEFGKAKQAKKEETPTQSRITEGPQPATPVAKPNVVKKDPIVIPPAQSRTTEKPQPATPAARPNVAKKDPIVIPPAQSRTTEKTQPATSAEQESSSTTQEEKTENKTINIERNIDGVFIEGEFYKNDDFNNMIFNLELEKSAPVKRHHYIQILAIRDEFLSKFKKVPQEEVPYDESIINAAILRALKRNGGSTREKQLYKELGDFFKSYESLIYGDIGDDSERKMTVTYDLKLGGLEIFDRDARKARKELKACAYSKPNTLKKEGFFAKLMSRKNNQKLLNAKMDWRIPGEQRKPEIVEKSKAENKAAEETKKVQNEQGKDGNKSNNKHDEFIAGLIPTETGDTPKGKEEDEIVRAFFEEMWKGIESDSEKGSKTSEDEQEL